MEITKSDFEYWWSMPVAQVFKEMLQEDLVKATYGGNTEAYARDQIGNAVRVGQIKAITHYMNLDFEQLTGRQE